MLSSKGMRVSLIGGAIFLPSALAILVLPALIGSIGMLIGGVMVFGGFIVTLVARIDQAELAKHGIEGASLGVEPTSNELAEIGKLIDEKKIKVIVSRTFPLSEAAKAQEQVATGHTRGKIVLKVAEEPK